MAHESALQLSGRKKSTLAMALADGCVTAGFICAAAAVVELSTRIAPTVGLSPSGSALGLLLALLVALAPLCRRLGGAQISPVNSALQFATGRGSAAHHACRMVSQAAGGALGVLVVHSTFPEHWQRDLHVLAVGLRPGVDIYAGAACEFVLCFLLSFTGLLSEDAPSRFLRFWVPLLAVVLAVRAGESYTGPCLNPVMALSWNLSYRWQSSAEHAVFWVANLCAAMFAGWSYLGCKQFAQERLAGRRPLGRLRPKAD